MAKNILIIDDDRSLSRVLIKALKNSNTDIESVGTLSEAWVEIDKNDYDVIITDVMLPDGDGLELVQKLTKKKLNLKIVVISAKNNLLTAVKASELGVFEYLPKPIDLNDLTIVVNRALQSQTNKKNQSNSISEDKLPIIGNSASMQNVYKTIAKLMKTDLTVLITGESGTGKELVAKAIHDYSEKSDEKFVVLNMAAIPKDLIESELFGYEKGAFTGADKLNIGYFEKAEGGTLFLDEIGDMPFDVQARLLRVLQMGEFSRVGGRDVIRSDVRIISATNKNLRSLVKNNTFREDLFFRLNVVNIHVPPLRDRTSDIVTLANFFINKFSKNSKKLHENSSNLLENYDWPGNVRELENFFKKISILYSEEVITPLIIKSELNENKSEKIEKNTSPNTFTESINEHLSVFYSSLDESSQDLKLYKRLLTEFEKPLFVQTLNFCKGNQLKASKLLGINRNTLRKKIQELKIK